MLIAHLGDKIHHPKNTLAAFEAAHGLGACAIATEVQLSHEQTPWCYSEDKLQLPVEGKRRPLHELHDRDLRKQPLTTFMELVDWARCHRHLDWFVELNQSSIDHFGAKLAIQSLINLLPEENDSFALLTSDSHTLRLARSLGFDRVALKVPSVARSLSAEVVTLAPDYLLIEHSAVDCQELPPGPWQWVVYEINSAKGAVHWHHRGAHHILTGNLPLLMRSREASNVYGI